MALYTISDLHLAFGANKPMDKFYGWDDYTNKINNNWQNAINNEDTVILPGDLSWALKLEDTLPDLTFVENLPGKKIISKGNHDLWWSTKNKVVTFFNNNNIKSIELLYNNAFLVENKIICGTRGWIVENLDESNKKILDREIIRLQLSLTEAKKLKKNNNTEIIVFFHYPPITKDTEYQPIIEILKNEQIKRCYYGHIHLTTVKRAFIGTYEGIDFELISSDILNFVPKKI